MNWQEELRRLDAELAAGTITRHEHRKQRDELLAAVSGGGITSPVAAPLGQAGVHPGPSGWQSANPGRSAGPPPNTPEPAAPRQPEPEPPRPDPKPAPPSAA